MNYIIIIILQIVYVQLAFGQISGVQLDSFRNKLNQVNKLLQQDNEPPLLFSTYTASQQFESDRGQMVTTIVDTNHDDFDLTSQGAVLSMYRNVSVYPEPYLSPPQPKWKEDEVKERAKDWIIALFGGLSGYLRSAEIRFNIRQNPPGHYNGKWVVCWRRVSKDGYPFFHDAVSANLDENRGCISASYNCDSIYKEDNSPIISSTEAAKICAIDAQHLLEKYVNKSIPSGITLGSSSEPPSLIVMNHNNAFDNDQIEALHYDLRASFAWRVPYVLNSGNKRIGLIIVCIDAHSSQPVAGDFVLP